MKTTIIAAFFACVFATAADARRHAPAWDYSGAYRCDMSSGRCGLENTETRSTGLHSRRFKAHRHTGRARHPSQDRVSGAGVGKGSSHPSKTRPAASPAVASSVLAALTERFVVPAAICGTNILRAFHAKIASIVEPVRPGFVQIKTGSGRTAVVAQSAASRFVAFIRDLEGFGYPIQDIGGYAYRRIAGTRRMSKHAFGLAVDINQLERDVVSVRMDRRVVSRLASRHGLVSGGDWRHGDLGHFEVAGSSPHRHHRHRHTRLASR